MYDVLDNVSSKEHLDDNDIDILVEYAQCNYSEIRSYVAELLVMAPNFTKAKNFLMGLSNDADTLVRANACDSLSVFASDEVYNRLHDLALSDDDAMVRGYALLSIADIMNEIPIEKVELITFFLSCLEKNRSEVFVELSCYNGLYRLGKKSYLSNIAEIFTRGNYQDRCAAVHVLGAMVRHKNSDEIMQILKKQFEVETENSVSDAIIHELSSLGNVVIVISQPATRYSPD